MADLYNEFQALLARAKVNVPEERRPSLYKGFVEVRRMAARMHAVRPCHAEIAPVFRVQQHD